MHRSSQQVSGASFFTGSANIGECIVVIFPMIFIGKTGKLPNGFLPLLFLGSICSIGSFGGVQKQHLKYHQQKKS